MVAVIWELHLITKLQSRPFSEDEEYSEDKPKKVHTAPREPKHKRSKNSQDDRWAPLGRLISLTVSNSFL